MNGILGLFLQILCVVGLGALILWILGQFTIDPMLYKIARIAVVVFVVILLFGAIFGAGWWPWPYRH